MPQIEPGQGEAHTEDLAWLHEMLEGIFVIEDVTMGTMGGRAIRLRGRFTVDTACAYERLAPLCRARGRTLMLRRDGEDMVILIVQGIIRPTPNNRWLPIALAAATILSVLFVFSISGGAKEFTLRGILKGMLDGWAFALSLLGILVAHELGHYFTARHFGVAVTLPYLIPFPLSPFGTLGAVIRMKDIPPSKRAMLMIGAAGPLVGLAVAIPVLLLGLSRSPVLPPRSGAWMEGNSLVYAGLKYLVFGRWLPTLQEDVWLDPIAFAGWAGLLVTSLNLIPAGQLDGGHVVHALLGDKARYLKWGVISALLILGIWWRTWWLWAALIFVFSRVDVRPMDDVSPLTPREKAIAIGLMVIFALTFTLVPLRPI